jgi:hypothetical protein
VRQYSLNSLRAYRVLLGKGARLFCSIFVVRKKSCRDTTQKRSRERAFHVFIARGTMHGLLFNENYELEVKSDLPIPKPGKNQALIKILAVSLNRRDFWITQGLYPNLKVIGKMKLSFTIRGEKKGC